MRMREDEDGNMRDTKMKQESIKNGNQSKSPAFYFCSLS